MPLPGKCLLKTNLHYEPKEDKRIKGGQKDQNTDLRNISDGYGPLISFINKVSSQAVTSLKSTCSRIHNCFQYSIHFVSGLTPI